MQERLTEIAVEIGQTLSQIAMDEARLDQQEKEFVINIKSTIYDRAKELANLGCFPFKKVVIEEGAAEAKEIRAINVTGYWDDENQDLVILPDGELILCISTYLKQEGQEEREEVLYMLDNKQVEDGCIIRHYDVIISALRGAAVEAIHTGKVTFPLR